MIIIGTIIVTILYHYIRLGYTGEFEYLWNSREIYEEDIQ